MLNTIGKNKAEVEAFLTDPKNKLSIWKKVIVNVNKLIENNTTIRWVLQYSNLDALPLKSIYFLKQVFIELIKFII